MHRRHTVYRVYRLWDDDRNFLLVTVRYMHLRIAFCIPVFLLFSTLALAAPPIITGKVVDERGTAITEAVITVNGVPARTDTGGRFELEADEADVYTLVYSADGYYQSIHSYSPLEISWFDIGGRSEIPAVTLVTRKPGRVMMAFGGDAMMGRRYSAPYFDEPVLIRETHRAEDTRALLQHIKPYLEQADFASVNLETQLMETRPEVKAPKSYVFFTPPEAAAALRDAGVDYVTLGNNHSNDYLAAGMTSTLQALESADMPFSGGGINEEDALRAHRAELEGHAYSFLGYVGWAGNFTPNQAAGPGGKSGAALGSSENIERTVKREIQAGRLPVVQYHGSLEYADEPTLVTESRLKQAIDDGAVLAIAHHPHVVQGFEIYNGKLVAYSLGNFMFDQFHYATKYSYMVYVWMDGEHFHRAEVMPIHIKGYTPMPATDTVRLKVLKRAHELSARRGIALGRSGGNGVIYPHHSLLQPAVFEAPREKGIRNLYAHDWSQPIRAITADEDQLLRFGMNLLPTGHFENHLLHGSPDRSWIEDGAQAIVRADDGNHVMKLTVPAGTEEERIGMRTFEYTFEPGTPSTFAIRAITDGAAALTAYQQWRGRRDNRTEALLGNRLRPIGQVMLEPGKWHDLRFDFDSPRVGAVSYRVVLAVRPADGSQDLEAQFDDFALIEWLTPPLRAGDLPPQTSVEQASHVDVR